MLWNLFHNSQSSIYILRHFQTFFFTETSQHMEFDAEVPRAKYNSDILYQNQEDDPVVQDYMLKLSWNYLINY